VNVFVTGAGGFLGSHVVERLLTASHTVTAMIRPASTVPGWGDRVKLYRGDLRAPAGLLEALQDIDVIVHLAAGTSGSDDVQFTASVVATEKLLEVVARSNVKRFVHISSLVVYDWTKAQGELNETTALDDNIYDMGGYAIAKLWQERIITRFSEQQGCQTTILRPGFIWGREHANIAGMGRQFGKVFCAISPMTNLPLTHVENCADCIGAVVERAQAAAQTYNVIDTTHATGWTYAGEYLRRTRTKAIRVPIPYWAGKGFANLATWTSRRLFGTRGQLPSFLANRRFEAQFKPLKFSTAKLEGQLKWKAPFDFKTCVQKSY
jgi:nucleoside-diphosphate-sugar epimerase